MGEFTSLSGFCNSAGSDAAGANSHGFVGFPDNDANLLKVRIPASISQIVGMAYPMTIYRTLVADLTACHEGGLPSRNEREV